MNTYSKQQLIRYLLGQTPPDLTQAIGDHATNDTELAAKLDVMRLAIGATEFDKARIELIGVSPPLTKRRPGGVEATPSNSPLARGRVKPWPLRRLLKLAACLLFVLLLTSLGYAGYAWWTAPLFADDFKSGWFDSSKWRAPPEIIKDGGVFAEKGSIKLINRGYLVTKQEFKSPIEVSFDWKWSYLGLQPLYADHLTVVLRTTGKPGMVFAYEAQDGVLIRFNAWDGTLSIWTEDEVKTEPLLPVGAMHLPAEQWHNIRITDDGNNISVYISGPAIPPVFSNKPIVQKSVTYRTIANHIAIYNREMLDEIPHESSIRAFCIRALK